MLLYFLCCFLFQWQVYASSGYIDIKNSTYNTLSAHQTFIGEAVEVTNFSLLIVTLKASPANASGKLYLEFSPDKINWDYSVQFNISNPSEETPHSAIPTHRFFRVRYINGNINQTFFRMQALYHTNKSKGLTSTMESKLTPTTDVENVRAIIMGKNQNNDYVNVQMSPERGLGVNILGPLSAFQELSVASLKPQIQLHFEYPLNDNLVQAPLTGTATATIENACLHLSTGTTEYSLAGMLSREVSKYEPGSGTEARFSAIFNTPFEGTTQLIGLGDSEDGLRFGYQGTDFGILRNYGGKDEVRTLVLSKKSKLTRRKKDDNNLLEDLLNLDDEKNNNKTITFTLNGTITDSIEISKDDTITEIAKKIADKKYYYHEDNQFYAYQEGNSVIFISFGSGEKNEEYSFDGGDSDIEGTFFRTRAGTEDTTEFIKQSDWSEDPADGTIILPTLDPTKGNVYQIQFQWLGFGIIKFGIQDPRTGHFVTVHKIKYANAYSTPSLYNPSMPLNAFVTNGSTNHNITVKTSSMASFTYGLNKKSRVRNSLSNDEKIDEAEKIILLLYVNRLHGTTTSRLKSFLEMISVGNMSKESAVFKCYRNPSFSGTFSLTNLNEKNSTMSYCKDLSNVDIIPETGSELLSIFSGPKEGKTWDVINESIVLYPGDFLVITGRSFDGENDLFASCSWIEDF